MRPLLILALPLVGCISEPSTFFYGIDLTQVELEVAHTQQGVYPDTSVLELKGNPFAETGIGEDQAWDLMAAGQHIPAWYAWATILTVESYGQPQYNTAALAHTIYDGNLTDDADLVWVREIALNGYQVLLEEWPQDRQYSADGTYSWPLAPLAYQGILDLGGSVDGWILIETVDGEQAVVQQ